MTTELRATPLTVAIAKAYQDDPRATDNTMAIALWETFCELYDRYGVSVEADIAKRAAVRLPIAKRQLMLEYIAKREADEDVEGVLHAAGVITMLEDEIFSKADHDVTQEKRDRFGRWVQADSGEGGLRDLVEPTSGTDRRGYRQLKAAGKAVAASSAATGLPGAAAGAAAQLVGELGPEAEEILGSHVRRTAYRYRGTSRNPSEPLQQDAHWLGQLARPISEGKYKHTDDTVKDARRPGDTRGKSSEADQAIAEAYSGSRGRGLSVDEMRLGMSSDLATMNLASSIPDIHQAQLSLKSGKMPPSVGFLIDSDGDIVSQAQGFSGDHYLPFDLKHLGALHGGAYARTRTTGGPTDEDIYTALVTGARQLTVASHSGVFTVEFDPSLRGGKRYTDKARQMTGRYAALLQRVGSGQQMQRPFSREERAQMREEAYRSAPGGDTEVAQQRLHEIEKQRRGALSFMSEDDVEDQARARVADQMRRDRGGSWSRPQQEQAIAETANQIRNQEAAKVYRLDGEGYESALKSLKQEFPFFIKDVRRQTWPEYTQSLNMPGIGPTATGSADIGYSRRGALAPAAVGGVDAAVGARRSHIEAKSEKTTSETPAGENRPATGANAEGGHAASAASATPDLAPLRDQLGRTVHGSYSVLTDVAPYAGEAAEGVDSFSAGEIVSQPLQDQGAWLREKYPTSEALTGWLAGPATPEQVEMTRKVFEHFKRRADVAEDPENLLAASPKINDLDGELKTLAMVKAPFDTGSSDPVLTVGNKPNFFPALAHGYDAGSMKDYVAEASNDPDLADRVGVYLGWDNSRIRDDIDGELEPYLKAKQAGERLKQPGADASQVPDADHAFQVASEGEKHPDYRQIELAQHAWMIAQAMKVTHALSGAQIPELDRDAGPKAPGFSKRDPASRQQQLWEQLRRDALALTPGRR